MLAFSLSVFPHSVLFHASNSHSSSRYNNCVLIRLMCGATAGANVEATSWADLHEQHPQPEIPGANVCKTFNGARCVKQNPGTAACMNRNPKARLC
jgi:hypothetical protein